MMDLDIVQFVRDNYLYDAEEVTLFGWGEPLLHPKLKEILDICTEFSHDATLRTYITTNGLFLDDYIDLFLSYPITFVQISLDAVTKELYEKIRVGSNFDKVVSNIAKFKDCIGSNRHVRPYVRLAMVTMNMNFHHMPLLVEFADRYNISEVKFPMLTAFNVEMVPQTVYHNLNLYRKHLYQAIKRGKSLGVKVNYPQMDLTDTRRHKHCHFPYTTLFVSASGKLRSCQSNLECLGHVTKTCWNDKAYKEMRTIVDDENKMPSQCGRCYQATVANWTNPFAHNQGDI